MALNLKAAAASGPSVKSMDVRVVKDLDKAVVMRFCLTVDGVRQEPWLEVCPVVERMALDIDGDIENWILVQQKQKVDGAQTTVVKAYRQTTA